MSAEPAQPLERNSHAAEAAYANAPDALRVELLRGVVCMAPAPAPRHQRLVLALLLALARRYDRRRRDDDGGPGGWVFVPEPELHLGARPDKLRPDIAGWREPRAVFALHVPAIAIAPDWVCEVLSPSTETIDRGTKAPLYAQHGVEWLWFVDPEAAAVEVFRNERGTFRLDATLRAEPRAGLAPFEAAPLERLFDD